MKQYLHKSVYVLNFNYQPHANKIRAFDMDSTLIETQSGRIFSTHAADYQWRTGVLTKLQELTKDGFGIIIFSNQKGLGSKDGKKYQMLVDKLNLLYQDLGSVGVKEVIFFLSAKNDWCRKPSPGMWLLFIQHFNNHVVPPNRMYIGDAAGRPNDFSCSDRKFAYNSGCPFQTPEQFFDGQEPEEFNWGGHQPDQYQAPPVPKFAPSANQEIILCTGYPGSGKSTWFTTSGCEGKGYVRVNQDTLKTFPKCKKVCRDAIAEGKSVYIDNTNTTKKTRHFYIECAQKAQIPIRCLYFDASLEICHHLNWCRAYAKRTNAIPNVAYHTMSKKFEEPSLDEGYTSITRIPFAPHFRSSREKRIYHLRF